LFSLLLKNESKMKMGRAGVARTEIRCLFDALRIFPWLIGAIEQLKPHNLCHSSSMATSDVAAYSGAGVSRFGGLDDAGVC